MKMISDKMEASLNNQIREEYFSFWSYQAMALKFEDMGLKVFAKWFYLQAGEEKEHAEKIAQYLIDQGAQAKLQALEQPKSDYKSAEEIVKEAVDHELHITRKINELVDQSQTENDHATDSFLKWFVDEQVEEVSTVSELLSLVQMAKEPDQLFMLEGRLRHMIENRK